MAMRKLAPRLHYHDHHRHQEKQTLSAFNSKQQEHDIFSKRTGPVPAIAIQLIVHALLATRELVPWLRYNAHHHQEKETLTACQFQTART